MSIKLHFQHSHIANLPESHDKVSDEQSKQLYQILMVPEERYRNRWDEITTDEYCLSIKRNCLQIEHSRKSYKRKFLP